MLQEFLQSLLWSACVSDSVDLGELLQECLQILENHDNSINKRNFGWFENKHFFVIFFFRNMM